MDKFERDLRSDSALGPEVWRYDSPETFRWRTAPYSNEFDWRPFGFREGPPFAWEALGPDKLRANFDDGSTQASVDFEIDPDGRVLGGFASMPPDPGQGGREDSVVGVVPRSIRLSRG